MTKADVHTFAKKIMAARTSTDVEELLDDATVLFGAMHWRPVGDRPNNIGTIRMASDPALALVERITNSIDALLDLGAHQNPHEAPPSPREAAQRWYAVPRQGLGDMVNEDRRKLGEKISVTLMESGESKRPTIVVEDEGIGQSPSAFSTTLLSLNESNKVSQPHTAGTYGQGGSATFGFSKATIILSRRHPAFTDGSSDMVGFTLVMEKDDPLNQRLPNYEYLVCADKSVIELDARLFMGLKHGTRITHISYDFQGWTGPFTTAAWQIFHQALFDPVLPFKVSGTRAKEAKLGSRIVIGNAARLSHVDAVKDIELAHFDAVKYELGPDWGSVIFNYWALERPVDSASASDVAASYVQAGSAVSMTLFGQRQDAEPRSWIREQAKLPFLYKNMVIQIDADGLSPIAKRELFASTRERATSSEIRSVIYKGLASTLLADEMLRRLDYEAKERALAKSTAATNDKVQRRLAKFVKTKLKDKFKPGLGGSIGSGGGRKKPPPGPKPEPRNIDDSHLKSSPTMLRFDPASRRVHQGSRTTVWVEVDAKNNFLPENDNLLTIVWSNSPGDKVRLVSRSKLLGGRSRWSFRSGGRRAARDIQAHSDARHIHRTSIRLLGPHGVAAQEGRTPGPRQGGGDRPQGDLGRSERLVNPWLRRPKRRSGDGGRGRDDHLHQPSFRSP